MKRRVIAGLAMAVFVSPAWAQDPQPEPARQHEVQRGETLWDLAGRYMNDPFQWPTLFQANRSLLSDPDLIYPGQQLAIPHATRSGGVRVTVQTGPADPDPLGRAVPDASRARSPAMAAPDPDRAVVRREPVLDRSAVRPGEFLTAPYVADPDALPVVGRFLRSLRTGAERWGGHVTSHPQDQVFLSYVEGTRPQPGDRVVVVEVGRRISEAGDGQRVIEPRGVVHVTGLDTDAIRGRLVEQFGPVTPGQRALLEVPMPDVGEAAEPVANGYDIEGRILAFVIDKPLYGRADLAFVDLGHRDGVRLGDVFMAYEPVREDAALDQALPPEPVAELRVIQTTDAIATVTVDALRLPRLRADLPVRRVRRMP